MEKKIKSFLFKVEGIILKIDLEMSLDGQVIIPLYKTTNEIILEHSTMSPIDIVEAEFKSLLPKSLKGDHYKELLSSFVFTIKQHINQYGRILPADLDGYLGEMVLIGDAISFALYSERMGHNEKYEMFNKVREITIKLLS